MLVQSLIMADLQLNQLHGTMAWLVCGRDCLVAYTCNLMFLRA